MDKRKLPDMKSPILITGCARSGTSLTAGILHICGAFGGDMFEENEYNKKGMFENKKIRQEVLKPYLKSINCDPLGQKELPGKSHDLSIFPLHITKNKEKILSIMISEGLKYDEEWFYKDAKICLVWYFWYRMFPDAKWIIVRRKKEQIINSCLRTRFMRAFSTSVGWDKWVNDHIEKFDQIKEIVNFKEIWPNQIIGGDFSELKSLIEWTGLEWKEELIKTFVSPILWGSQK